MHINQQFPFLRNALGFVLFWNDNFLHFDISPQNEKSCFSAVPCFPPCPPKKKPTKNPKQQTNPLVSLGVYPVPLGPGYAVLKGASAIEM